MNKEKMYMLNSPEMEIQFELMLIVHGNPEKIITLVQDGWGIYPIVLNALVANGYILQIPQIFQKLCKFEKYPVDEMKAWMEAYYGQNWKDQVIQFKLQKIAEKFFTFEECVQNNFSKAIRNQNRTSAWENLALAEGIDSVKETYVKACNALNQGSPAKEKAQVYELERFLCARGEYEFLYEQQCWRGLSSTLDGVRYIAETKHYMNGLAECLLSYHSEMSKEVLDYCQSVLDKAPLDDHYRPRYQAWKERQKHNCPTD